MADGAGGVLGRGSRDSGMGSRRCLMNNCRLVNRGMAGRAACLMSFDDSGFMLGRRRGMVHRRCLLVFRRRGRLMLHGARGRVVLRRRGLMVNGAGDSHLVLSGKSGRTRGVL